MIQFLFTIFSSTKDIYILRNMSVTSITLFYVTWACNSIGNIAHTTCARPRNHRNSSTNIILSPSATVTCRLSARPPDYSLYRMMNARLRRALRNSGSLVWQMRRRRPEAQQQRHRSQWCRLTSLARSCSLYHFQSPLHSITISTPSECKDVKPTFSKCHFQT